MLSPSCGINGESLAGPVYEGSTRAATRFLPGPSNQAGRAARSGSSERAARRRHVSERLVRGEFHPQVHDVPAGRRPGYRIADAFRARLVPYGLLRLRSEVTASGAPQRASKSHSSGQKTCARQRSRPPIASHHPAQGCARHRLRFFRPPRGRAWPSSTTANGSRSHGSRPVLDTTRTSTAACSWTAGPRPPCVVSERTAVLAQELLLGAYVVRADADVLAGARVQEQFEADARGPSKGCIPAGRELESRGRFLKARCRTASALLRAGVPARERVRVLNERRPVPFPG